MTISLRYLTVPIMSGLSSRNGWGRQSDDTLWSETDILENSSPSRLLLMVEPSPFTYICGYANRFNEMLRYLSRVGDEVEIVASDFEDRQNSVGDEEMEDVDSEPQAGSRPLHVFGFNIHYARWSFSLPGYKRMPLSLDFPSFMGLRVAWRMKPHLIHVSSPGFLVFAAILYSRLLHIPLVMSYHTHIPVYAKSYVRMPWADSFAWMIIWVVHFWADLTLVTSPQIAEEFASHGIQRVEVWKKGIDTERFNPRFRDDDTRRWMSEGHPNDFLMVYIGRLGAEKRLKDIKPVLERMPGTRLCIVGGGPQERVLREHFAGTPTHFVGQLRGDELSRAFASADVFVMPSDSETLGFVVLESMASGVPVVAAEAGGVPDLIEDGATSFLVWPGDTDAFIERLKRLREDEELRKCMGKAAKASVQHFSWDESMKYLRDVQFQLALVNFQSRLIERLLRCCQGEPGAGHYSDCSLDGLSLL